MALTLSLFASVGQNGFGCYNRTTHNASRTACACTDFRGLRVAFVSCDGPPVDGGFKELAVNGVDQALASGGGCFDILTTGGTCDSEPFAEAVDLVRGYQVVLAAGFNQMEQMQAAAAQHPSSFFALVDVAFAGEATNNTQGMNFAEDQAGYMAGYLAGSVTRTGVVGTVLGPELPPIRNFGNGFAKGALDACRAARKQCVAYQKYVSDFNAPARGALVATRLASLGADVIFEAGGTTGSCALVRASHIPSVAAVIRVDVDRSLYPASCLGSSVVRGAAA